MNKVNQKIQEEVCEQVIIGKISHEYKTQYAIAAALFAIAEVGEDLVESHDSLVRAMNKLGVADAHTPMGAIEALSKSVMEGFEEMSSAIRGHYINNE